jgi:hypothetical protein
VEGVIPAEESVDDEDDLAQRRKDAKEETPIGGSGVFSTFLRRPT